jgi:transcriptional antiterminator RfaH
MLAGTQLLAPVAPWAVINSHPHREQVALENLQRQDFTAYCPMLRRRRSHARRVTSVLRPLFPGYLFVSTGTNFGHWRPILSTYGVRSIVRSGQDISCIDHAFIASLREREVDGAIVRPLVPYQIGQIVKIVDSSFDGLVAKIIDMDEKDRLVVLLDLMNRSTKVILGSHQVRAA